jgi:hypothetical protein
MPIRLGGHGSLAEADRAQVYEQPNESSKVVGQLAKGKLLNKYKLKKITVST